MGLFEFFRKKEKSEAEIYMEQRRRREAMDEQANENNEGFRMRVEDVFAITGRGTVVTGKVETGYVRTGDYVCIAHGDQVITTTVTGIEMFRRLSDIATAGDNVGILLKGLGRDDVQKGDLLYTD